MTSRRWFVLLPALAVAGMAEAHTGDRHLRIETDGNAAHVVQRGGKSSLTIRREDCHDNPVVERYSGSNRVVVVQRPREEARHARQPATDPCTHHTPTPEEP